MALAVALETEEMAETAETAVSSSELLKLMSLPLFALMGKWRPGTGVSRNFWQRKSRTMKARPRALPLAHSQLSIFS